jgi:hypothetical protein
VCAPRRARRAIAFSRASPRDRGSRVDSSQIVADSWPPVARAAIDARIPLATIVSSRETKRRGRRRASRAARARASTASESIVVLSRDRASDRSRGDPSFDRRRPITATTDPSD